MKYNSHQGEKRTEDDLMIFGIRPVIEAIAAGKEVERIFVQRDLSGDLAKELRQVLASNNIHASLVPIDKLNRLTRKNHQGVVCFLSQVSYCRVEDVVPGLFNNPKYPVVLLLDRITDVRNFGAICRTAEFTGVDAVIVPEKGGALVNGDAVKASAGAINRIVICREFNLKETIQYLHDSGFYIVGCTEKGDHAVYEHQFDGPLCIIMGSEEDGISPEYLKKCDARLKIPLIGKTASLNVSVAAGMILYEVLRQKLISKK
jgi:23S rRNA (guanosine2251-2'-O)-methyltransferase